jgi:hypothetical protein
MDVYQSDRALSMHCAGSEVKTHEYMNERICNPHVSNGETACFDFT